MDLKGNNFKPMRGLEIEVVLESFQEVTEKKTSLYEMASHCNEVKQLKVVQKSFIVVTGMENWEEVTEKLPSFATPEALDEFTSVKNFTSTDRYN